MKVRVLLAAMAIAGCSSLGEDELFVSEPIPDAGAPPDAELPIDPTLDALYDRVFLPLCSCHQSPTPDGALSFRREFIYTELIGRASTCDGALTRVVEGDPDNSFLVQKLAAFTNGDPLDCGIQMPASVSPLTPLQLDAVRQWIADGAPNFETP